MVELNAVLYAHVISGVIVTLVLWNLIGRTLFKPFLENVYEREEKTSGASEKSHDIHAEGQRLETQIRESLQSARLEALRVRDSQLAAAKTEAQEINEAAAAHAAREADALKEELSKIRSRATADLEKEVESLASLLVSRVLEKPVNRVLH